MSTTPVKSVTNTTPGKHQKDTPKADRFIPNRVAMDLDISNYNLVCKVCLDRRSYAWRMACSPTTTNPCSQENIPQDQRTEYSRNLAKQLFTDTAEDNKVLAFKQKPPTPMGNAHLNTLRFLHQHNKKEGQPKVKTTRCA